MKNKDETYDTIKRVLGEMAPNPDSFAPEIYSYEDVRRDEDQLRARKLSPKYKEIDPDGRSKQLEYAFTDSAEKDDWFCEIGLYDNDPNSQGFTTIPTSEIDDNFNHVDTIGLISNELTNYKTLPFAIDLTFDTKSEDINKKFEHKHLYGKKNPSDDRSEFGINWVERTEQGTFHTMTKPLDDEDRNGLKIPGFASVKYFEDTNGTDMLPKGRIRIMPRFVAGFNPDLAAKLVHNVSVDERAEAGRIAKWCALIELCKQSEAIKKYLNALPERMTKNMDPEELSIAKQQIEIVDEYFQKAMQETENKAKTNINIFLAKSRAERDFVCQTILAQTKITFNPPSSEHHRFFVSHM